MTERLYYTDAYLRMFDSAIVERLTVDGRAAVVLSRTALYAGGGGQPCDVGVIDGVAVVEVYTRETDGAVVHVLAGEIDAQRQTVTAEVDWARRFDMMQQHTGQHILTRAIIALFNVDTVGFHLTADNLTIDLNAAALSDAQIAQAETYANAVIVSNRAVSVRFMTEEALQDVRMRRLPEKIYTEKVRIIDIADFDVNACGGTHVAHTGEVGVLKITQVERKGGKVRVRFCCGGRALREFQHNSEIVRQLTQALTCAPQDVLSVVKNTSAELHEAKKLLKGFRQEFVQDLAKKMLAAVAADGDKTILYVRAGDLLFDADAARQLAMLVTQTAQVRILVGLTGEKAHLVYARHAQAQGDMNRLLQQTLATVGGRGGGKPDMAQGGGTAVTLEQMQAALTAARAAVDV
jgi:alanyl-tRNA synthetase